MYNQFPLPDFQKIEALRDKSTKGQRFKIRFDFQLNIHNQDDLETMQIISELKKRRRFLPALRLGLRIVFELWQGKTDTLKEHFSWVFAQESTVNQQFQSMFNEIVALKEKLSDRTVFEGADAGIPNIPKITVSEKPVDEQTIVNNFLDMDW